jgi:hypothetical protein
MAPCDSVPSDVPVTPNSAANRRALVECAHANGDLSMNLSVAGGLLLFSSLPEANKIQCQIVARQLIATYRNEGMSEPTALGAAVLVRTSNRSLFDEMVRFFA